MTSVTSPDTNFIKTSFDNTDENETIDMVVGSCPSNTLEYNFSPTSKYPLTKASRAFSYNEPSMQPSLKNSHTVHATTDSNNTNSRLKHLCTRLKHRFSLSKECRTRSEDSSRGMSVRFNSYKSFSSSTDEACSEFTWPDFERIYDSIPICLIKNLPGFDDLSVDENEDSSSERESIVEDDDDEPSFDLFQLCQRGTNFRRNAICRKVDKTQYNGQWNTFIQQLMVEKLIRIWT